MGVRRKEAQRSVGDHGNNMQHNEVVFCCPVVHQFRLTGVCCFAINATVWVRRHGHLKFSMRLSARVKTRSVENPTLCSLAVWVNQQPKFSPYLL
eukprot:1482254-Amphidinium_carterae.1